MLVKSILFLTLIPQVVIHNLRYSPEVHHLPLINAENLTLAMRTLTSLFSKSGKHSGLQMHDALTNLRPLQNSRFVFFGND